MTSRRVLLAAFCTALLLGLAWGCAAADQSGSATPAGGGASGNIDASNDGQVIMPDGSAQDSGSLGLNPLCGKLPTEKPCVPDSPISCAAYHPPVVASEDAGDDAALSGQAGAKGEGGSGGDSAGPAISSGAGDGGASGVGGASSAAGDSGISGAAGASGAPPVIAPKYSCQVQRTASAPRVAFSACALAGPGAENAPCLTSNDCQAGLGCVGDQSAGLCQKFCCQDANDCESGSYCAERPLRDKIVNGASSSSSLLIPVCVHAENCDLSATYPCPNGSECACKTGTACLVVRSDGTTTCAVPGTGKAGDACPCAWGHVCSAATNQCLKLCYTRDSGPCGDGKCQSASELPDGWGVCVGGTPSGG